jgi:hypothetical protein
MDSRTWTLGLCTASHLAKVWSPVWSRSSLWSLWSLAVGTSLPPVSALHWPFSGKCYAKPTLVRWRFESIPDLELRRAPLSLALACAPFSSSNCCPPVDCLSSPPSPLPRPLCASSSRAAPRSRKLRAACSCPRNPPTLRPSVAATHILCCHIHPRRSPEPPPSEDS